MRWSHKQLGTSNLDCFHWDMQKKSDCAFRDSEAAAFRSPMQADAPFSWVAVSSSNVACVEKHEKFEKQFDM